MRRQRSSSNFNSSFGHGSGIGSYDLAQQNGELVNASGQGDHSSTIGWMGQTSSSIEPSTLQTVTSDLTPDKIDLNIPYEDSNRNPLAEIGVNYVNQSSDLHRNTEIFERNTRQRVYSANEQGFPSPNVSSTVHVGSTSQMFQQPLQSWIPSPGSSSMPAIFPVMSANGSIAMWREGNLGYNPINYSSQNGASGSPSGFTSGFHLSSTASFPLGNMAEESEQRLSGVINPSMMSLAGFGSGGQIGYLMPSSSASVTMRSMLDSRPGNIRALQSPLRRRILMMSEEVSNDVVPPVLLSMQPSFNAESIARAVHHALEILRGVDAALQYEDGLIVHGPLFYDDPEEGHDVHEDMRLDVDDMSYEDLLALQEQMGNVGSGLSEEAILGAMKRLKYQSMRLGPPVGDELCCVCQVQSTKFFFAHSSSTHHLLHPKKHGHFQLLSGCRYDTRWTLLDTCGKTSRTMLF